MLYCLYMFVCVSHNVFLLVKYVVMPPKTLLVINQLSRQRAYVHQSQLRLWLHLTLPNGSSIQDLSPSALASLPSKTCCSHLKGHNLSAVGIKLIMANRLYQFLHPITPLTNDPSSMSGNTVAPTITTEMA